MKRFRLLEPDEIECRVDTCNTKGCSLLLYKNARTDADLLDETVGAEHWDNDFREIAGVLYGGIGVDYGDGHLVWKWDAGTESNYEAEKGRASDAFKRAGFKHGIGRELYSSPFIWVPADKCKIETGRNGKPACYDEFVVKHIGYDERERINALVITVKGKTVYSMGSEEYICTDCGKAITPYTDRNGKLVGVRRIAETTRNSFGRSLCMDCAANAKPNRKEN